MKILIVAKTRMGSRACIGGITFEGVSVRLIAADAARNDRAGMEYEMGEVWEIEATPDPAIVPPHSENIIIAEKRRLAPMVKPEQFIEQRAEVRAGGIEVLFEGQLQATKAGATYIAERTGTPPFSTQFWRPDQALHLEEGGKRIRYRFPTPDGGRTLTFVGFQEPIETLPANALLRVSLAQWWRPDDPTKSEQRCYAQLSGWYLGEDVAGTPVKNPSVQQFARLEPAPVPAVSMSRAGTVLKSIFGYDKFLPLQSEIIDNISKRHDTLTIMPTGSGKSLCFQLPALLFSGITVVVSPLIALMQDQVNSLLDLGIPAAFLNSTLDYATFVQTVRRVRAGEIKLLYAAPETLLKPETILLLENSEVACIAIDEAHCISEWGHDFRPEYRQLTPFRKRFPGAVCVALTATATKRVQTDIQHLLGFRSEDTFVASFDRPNLHLAVEQRWDGLNQTLAFLDAHPQQSGIIYCTTRAQVEDLAADLQDRGYSALPYHAGLETQVRRENQKRFTQDDVDIIVATIAFGMGIDKSNVRFILHFNLPNALETYYQAIGRAGRDGLKADCLLLYNHGDSSTIIYFIEEGAVAQRPGRRARLDAMLRYAQTRQCRRRPLLDYFDETYPAENCGMCDNCMQITEPDQLVDGTEAARLCFTCIQQTGSMFGPTYIIKVLRGSLDKRIVAGRHDRLPCHGSGRMYTAKQWKRLIFLFIEQGLIQQDQEYGGLSLCEAGKSVMQGEEVFLPVEEEAPTPSKEELAYDVVLFENLRRLRKALADEKGIPPYVVFSDRSLIEMATYFPQTPPSFLAIHGVGEHKLRSYGEVILSEIRAYCREKSITERPKKRSRDRSPRRGKRRYQEIGARFADGSSITEIQSAFSIKHGTVIAHLHRYYEEGYDLDCKRLYNESALDTHQRDAVLATFAELGHEMLRPTYEKFAGSIPYEELHLLRLVYRCRGPESDEGSGAQSPSQ